MKYILTFLAVALTFFVFVASIRDRNKHLMPPTAVMTGAVK